MKCIKIYIANLTIIGRMKMEKSNRELMEGYDYKYTNEFGETWYIKQKDKNTYLITGDDVNYEIKEMPLHGNEITINGITYIPTPYVMNKEEKKWLVSCIEKMKKRKNDWQTT